jgi:hypothetical protein
MIRLIVFAVFAVPIAMSGQAMSPRPLHQSDGITQVNQLCGPGQVRSKGNCAWKATSRPVNRGDGYRQCVAWSEGFCVQYR